MDGLFVELQWNLEQATGVAGQEEQHGDDKLRTQEE